MNWWIGTAINHWNTFLTAAGYVAVGWVIAKLMALWAGKFFQRLATRTKTTLDDRLAQAVQRPAVWVIFLVGLHLGLDHLKTIQGVSQRLAAFDTVYFPSVMIIAFAWLANRVAQTLLQWYLHELAGRQENTAWDKELLPMAGRVIGLVIGFVALSMVLGKFGIEVTALITTAGVASAAVAFASQETLSNMISGFTILVDRPFKVGDVIELDDGKMGEVVDIGLRATTIKLYDGNGLLVPNKDLTNSRLTNLSKPNPMRAIRERISIPYSADVERCKQVVLECLKARENVVGDPEPSVVLLEFGPSAIVLYAIGWVDHWSKWFATRDAFLHAVWRRFREEGIQFPFPQQDVHLYYENATIKE